MLQVWRSLLSQPAMAAPMGLNAAYWLILSGSQVLCLLCCTCLLIPPCSQMTILPLYLVGSPNFGAAYCIDTLLVSTHSVGLSALSSSEIGGVFALIAGVGVLGTPAAAALLDKLGKVQVLHRGVGLLVGSAGVVQSMVLVLCS